MQQFRGEGRLGERDADRAPGLGQVGAGALEHVGQDAGGDPGEVSAGPAEVLKVVAERLVVEDLGWHRQIGEWVEAVVVPGVMWGVEELAQRAAGAAQWPEHEHAGEGLAEPGRQQVPVAGAAADVAGGARGERRLGYDGVEITIPLSTRRSSTRGRPPVTADGRYLDSASHSTSDNS
ncbi:hypothetical protein ACTWLT_19235 [Micromonospora sp. ZYX-F-536]|uniref:hypothetical protein n=1 Tax=Micromonospora sp. ZYX-F-536 TaxID=3457629 RepID=UPI0040407928